ncbi:thioesterase family protein [Kingella negevensis]|uniref:Long-chain acyl-CoA thioesterase FadM n=1 Tax=Kingella negevensis TaxID=1522312 RepID=A0A238TA62_9NEIS|nr:thioesterase family protein [Kingella negevensis]MDK4681309.1 thioesterase family protein [Kingella negevensis]MDK4683506.1 thioesterase family protein [Kingella negevensis]MDK4684049.1 thioesterase family protein [Kingella negevensis]MDK4691359.1 thioesterase family protein [Kingella negevensis]MDK4693492.1 thioesterase family protein [Kingella negevensis]
MIQPLIINVLNYHLDGYGHVNNARYLEFLEAARWHFFQQHGLQDTLRQANLVVSRADIRYRRAACLNDLLHIHSQISSVQSRQIVLQQPILFADTNQVCMQAEITLMPTTADGKVFRLPENLLNHFAQLIHIP